MITISYGELTLIVTALALLTVVLFFHLQNTKLLKASFNHLHEDFKKAKEDFWSVSDSLDKAEVFEKELQRTISVLKSEYASLQSRHNNLVADNQAVIAKNANLRKNAQQAQLRRQAKKTGIRQS